MQEKLKQFILYINTIQINNTVDCQVEIYSKTAKKLLNWLKYKQKDIQKRVFFYRPKRENIMKY